ncbi:MAG: hypothetical protein OEW60_00625 [Thiovulaceae bacterium]|nr:hypothetical protein [Sulfurimonadaceae bacterium]
MSTSTNNSSINESSGAKVAAYGNQTKSAMKAGFQPEYEKQEKQVINARKGANVALAKAKAKKKAKMAKASRKKNK